MSLQAALRFEADSAVNSNMKKPFEAQVERIKYDEKMAARDNAVRLYQYNDFWDQLLIDVDHIVKKADEQEEQEGESGVENNTALRADWNENLERTSWTKRIRNDHKSMGAEMKMASKAALSVRRVALKQLLEREYDMFEQELSLQGKTFYKQRV